MTGKPPTSKKVDFESWCYCYGYRGLPLLLKPIVKPLKFKANHSLGNLLSCASHALYQAENMPSTHALRFPLENDHWHMNLWDANHQKALICTLPGVASTFDQFRPCCNFNDRFGIRSPRYITRKK